MTSYSIILLKTVFFLVINPDFVFYTLLLLRYSVATDSWAMNIDRGFVNAVVFLDLKKAFDTLDHSILLTKLQFYGIRGFCHKWFTSYLSNRTQTCLMNSFTSSPKLGPF